jgi:hypothetical protein
MTDDLLQLARFARDMALTAPEEVLRRQALFNGYMGLHSKVSAALSHPAPNVPGAEEVEQIRARHEADSGFESDGMESAEWRAALTMLATRAHTDRATLLALLDAARAELAGVKEALKPFADYASEWDDPEGRYGEGWADDELAYDPVVRIEIGAFRRARAALAKDAPDPLGDQP